MSRVSVRVPGTPVSDPAPVPVKPARKKEKSDNG